MYNSYMMLDIHVHITPSCDSLYICKGIHYTWYTGSSVESLYRATEIFGMQF